MEKERIMQKLWEDMALRGLAEHTKKLYRASA